MLRCPGGLHEWLMVARADKVKQWGITLAEYRAMRTPIDAVAFVNPPARHGGPGSVRAHHELLAILEQSESFAEFKARLEIWAETRVAGGAQALPAKLR